MRAAAARKRTRLTLKAGTALGPIVHVAGEVPRELLDRGAVRVRSTQSTQILALPVRDRRWYHLTTQEWTALHAEMTRLASLIAAQELVVLRQVESQACCQTPSVC